MARINFGFSTLAGKVCSVNVCVIIFCIMLMARLANSAELTYSIQEEQPRGTWVGNVAEDYNLRSTMTSDDYANLIYKILFIGNPFASYFRVVNTTGDLYTTDPIDRDAISHCELLDNCSVTLDVAVQSAIGSFFRKINIEIFIGDQNDNSPVFDNPYDRIEFSENSARRTTATISGANDRDRGNNTVKRYFIPTPNVPFDVEWENYVDGRSVVNLVVVGDLDRETKDFYQIKVVAEDDGDPIRTGSVDVDITILDVNDNTPVFDRPFYNVTIKEDIGPDAIVETITATDKDIGKNGEIIYMLSDNQPNDNVFNSFAINSTTGALTVIGEIDYVPNEQTRIYVEASDLGNKPKIALVVVYLNILDSTNKPPVINVNILSGEFVARVSEYANVGAVVAHVGVIDDDTGRNGKVDCIGVSDKDNFGLERLQTKEYKAVVMKPLNRELKDTHEVKIICRDNGSPPLNSTATFNVQVMDENDNTPRFTQGTYFAKAYENNKIGDVVATVLAEDIDININAEIEYSLLKKAGYNFWMDPGTGEIRANFKLDRENVSKINLTVMATDRGQPRLSATSNVILTVEDQNDNYPNFSQPNYEFFVYEGVPYNTTVDQLTANDKDYGNNAAVLFSFDTRPSASFPFVLYSDGTIKMIRGLDRESQDRYEFKVVASDQGTPPLSTTATVTVIVLDVNDNAPVFVFPVEDNNTATIPFSSSPDTATIVITATDSDESINGQVSYSILDNNLTSLFSLESKDGHGYINLLRFPTSSEALAYTFRIKAEDMGHTKQSSVQSLNIVFIKEAPVEESRRNFLIAISLGCVTVVLSIAIVLIIFLIRRHDSNRNKDCSDCSDKMDLEVVPAESKTRVDLSSVTSGSKESLKKVSFSTDYNSTLDSSDTSKDLQQSPLVNQDSFNLMQNGRLSSPSPSPRNYIQHPGDTDLQKLDPVKALQLHRSLLQSHDQLWTNHRDGHTPPLTKEILKHHEDNGSESSGETATYDSGRGGSESDIQTSYSQSHDPDHIKTVTFANKPVLHHFPPSNRWDDLSINNHNYNNSVLHNNLYKNNTSPTKSRDILPPSSSSHHRAHQHDHNLSPIQDASHHMTSYDDDDDTTTSGSYTIDNEDWMSESNGHSRPYILSRNEAYC